MNHAISADRPQLAFDPDGRSPHYLDGKALGTAANRPHTRRDVADVPVADTAVRSNGTPMHGEFRMSRFKSARR
jgi:hypothetical protein